MTGALETGETRARTVAGLSFAALVAAVAIAAIDLRNLSNQFTIVDDGARLFAAPVALAAVAVIAASQDRRPWDVIAGTPLRWFWAWALWAALAGLAGTEPTASLVLASTYAAMVLLVARLALIPSALPAAIACSGLVFLAGSVAGRMAGAEVPLIAGRLDLLAFEANQLARFMGITVLAGGWLAETTRGGWRLVGLASAGAGVGVLLLSESRTGLLALGAAGLAYLYRRHGHYALLASLTVVMMVVGGLALINKLDGVLEVFSRGNISDLRTATGRTEVWPPFLEQIEERPLTGHGLGALDAVGLEATTEGELDFTAEHAHNLALQVAVGTGLVGLVLMAGGVVATVVGTTGRRSGAWPTALLVFVLVDGVTEGVLLAPSFGWVALLAAAAGSVQAADQTTNSPTTKASSPALR